MSLLTNLVEDWTCDSGPAFAGTLNPGSDDLFVLSGPSGAADGITCVAGLISNAADNTTPDSGDSSTDILGSSNSQFKPASDGSQAFTCAAWIKASSVSAIFGQARANNGVGGTNWRVYGSPPTFEFTDLSSISDGSTVIADNNWHYIAITYNGSTATLYIDGTQVASGSTSITDANGSGDTLLLLLGDQDQNTGVLSNQTAGLLDQPDYWSRALSSGEISQLYNSGAGLAYPFGSGVTLTPDTASLTLTGYAPKLDTGIKPGAAALTLTGFAPKLDTGLKPGPATLTLTGYAPTLLMPVVCTPTAAALTLTGYAPTVTVAPPPDTGSPYMATFARKNKRVKVYANDHRSSGFR